METLWQRNLDAHQAGQNDTPSVVLFHGAVIGATCSSTATHVIPSRRKATLMAKVGTLVDPDATVYTDAAHAYGKLPQRHEAVNHHTRVHVSGNVHTNTIEGFWSLVKRGISGTHHSVSPKWLLGYLNEYAWRYNHRDAGRVMFLSLLLRSAVPLG